MISRLDTVHIYEHTRGRGEPSDEPIGRPAREHPCAAWTANQAGEAISTTPNATVKSARRVVDIFEALAETQEGLTLSDLSRRLSIPKSSTSCIVQTLLERKYLERTPGGHLVLGARLFDVGVCARAETRLQTVARPIMARLMEQTSESVFIGILTPQSEVLFLDKVVSTQAIRYDADLGQLRAPHSSSLGKVLLAHLPDEQLEYVLRTKQRSRFTSRTLVDRSRLVKELKAARDLGVAFAVDERVAGVSSIAAVIRATSGRAIAGLVVAGPTHRILQRREELVPRLIYAASEISEALARGVPVSDRTERSGMSGIAGMPGPRKPRGRGRAR